MAIGLLGRKLGMTQVFDEHGAAVPVTLIEVGPCPILQKRILEKDGYSALQIAFAPRSDKNVTRPMLGHFKKAGVGAHRYIREVRLDDANGYEVGQTLRVDLFSPGDQVDVRGTSKGRGFAGPIKRHGVSRGPESHGSRYHRRPGSMGQSATPSRVFKGKVGAGRYGNSRHTAQNLTVVRIDADRNLLAVKGSIPGGSNGYVMVCRSVKPKQTKGR
jgi:large subunit ribosomal protein L3